MNHHFLWQMKHAHLSQPTQSAWGKVLITNVTLAATGLYRCEVYGPAPTFAVDTRAVQLRVLCECRGGCECCMSVGLGVV